MLKKILTPVAIAIMTISTIPPIVVGSLNNKPVVRILDNNKNINHNEVVTNTQFHKPQVYKPDKPVIEETFENLDYVFLNDLKNIRDDDYLKVFSSFTFEQYTIKKVYVLGAVSAKNNWTRTQDYNFNNKVIIDLKNDVFKLNIFPSTFNFTFVDPDPGYGDPAKAARWNNKDWTYNMGVPQTIQSKMNHNLKWYGDELNGFLHSDSKIINVDAPKYPNHDYFVCGVSMEVWAKYWTKEINKNVLIKNVTNHNIINSFIDSKELKFNDNISFLACLKKAKDTINFLNDFIQKYTFNGLWTNKYISKDEVIKNINNIENLKFNSYYQFDDLIKNYNNNTPYNITGDYSKQINKLNNSLIKNNLITKSSTINLNNINDFYETVLLFFRNNEIYAKSKNKSESIKVWDGKKFITDNINYLNNNQIEYIEIKYIDQPYGSKEYNENWKLYVENNTIVKQN